MKNKWGLTSETKDLAASWVFVIVFTKISTRTGRVIVMCNLNKVKGVAVTIRFARWSGRRIDVGERTARGRRN